jgi:hypothetical protein
MWVVLKQPDRVVWGQIAEIKPDVLVINPSDPIPIETGSKVTMAGLAFGHVPTQVVGTRNGRVLVQRPPSVQLWFRTRRTHRRLPLELSANLEFDSGVVSGISEDVSLGGALLLVPPTPGLIASGERCKLTLVSDLRPIVCDCALRFSAATDGMRHLGVQFIGVSDPDHEELVRRLEALLSDFASGGASDF